MGERPSTAGEVISRWQDDERILIQIALLFIAGVIAIFGRSIGFPFIAGYDDEQYILENYRIHPGLTVQGIRWAFSTMHASNWHPLTWISHMLDIELFGLSPGGHHLTSVLFHGANSLLLWFVLYRMTRSWGKSGVVAALFAFHPLHVESVAWVAQRKDLVSAFFFLLAVGAYIRYTERPSPGRYLPVLALFALGLMAKPMLVTLPFLLLLIDFWPLRRASRGDAPPGPPPEVPPLPWSRLLLEKVPLLGLTAASCFITYVAQKAGGAVSTLESIPLGVRLGNTLVSYVIYLGKTMWPGSLAVFYPHPGTSLPMWQVGGSLLVLACASLLVVRLAGHRPYLAVGWFWFLGSLVPVIGFVQVGAQAMADRYTYLPLIGIFVAAAWGIPDLLPRERVRGSLLTVAFFAAVAVLAAAAWLQVGYWRNTQALFQRALDVTSENWVAHNNLGVALSDRGQVDDAISHFRESIRINPRHATARNNFGVALRKQGRIEEAEAQFREALRINPGDAVAQNSLGVILGQKGMLDEAIARFREALRLNSDYPSAHYNLGFALLRQSKADEAMGHFHAVLRVKPGDPKTLHQMKRASEMGR
jgi:Tfp pilus assembly protein PilF